jgi:small-conductance mechanosensitive channel
MDPNASPVPSISSDAGGELTVIWQTIQSMTNDLLGRLPYIAVALVVFVFFYFAGKGVRVLVRRLADRSKRNRNLGIVFGRLTQWLIWFIGLLVATVIAVPRFTPGQLIQLLGISGVAIGFAFRDILQNFLAGILILLTEPFRINDQIIFGDYEGTVEDIQTRATYIKTYDGRRVVIPNAELFINSVVVNTAFNRRRLEYDVGIGYGDDIDRAKELIFEVLDGIPNVLKDPQPEVLVVELAESSVNLRVMWWIKPPRRLETLAAQDAVLAAIKQRLYVEEGIDLPYPTRQILFHDQTEATDGDRAHQREGWPAGNKPVPQPRTIAGMLGNMQEVHAHDQNDQLGIHNHHDQP